MLEAILVSFALVGMGVYFVKSADLPKELKERQAVLEAEAKRNPSSNLKKFNFEKIQTSKTTAKAEAVKKVVNLVDKAKIDQEINSLTFKITELEQQIRDNNQKNLEIQAQINTHLNRLEELNKLRIS